MIFLFFCPCSSVPFPIFSYPASHTNYPLTHPYVRTRYLSRWAGGGGFCRIGFEMNLQSTPRSSHFPKKLSHTRCFVLEPWLSRSAPPAVSCRPRASLRCLSRQQHANFLGKFPGRKDRECQSCKGYRSRGRYSDDVCCVLVRNRKSLVVGPLCRRQSKVMPSKTQRGLLLTQALCV
jgi:hypothetical protein